MKKEVRLGFKRSGVSQPAFRRISAESVGAVYGQFGIARSRQLSGILIKQDSLPYRRAYIVRDR
jgi:hypothetical protein